MYVPVAGWYTSAHSCNDGRRVVSHSAEHFPELYLQQSRNNAVLIMTAH